MKAICICIIAAIWLCYHCYRSEQELMKIAQTNICRPNMIDVDSCFDVIMKSWTVFESKTMIYPCSTINDTYEAHFCQNTLIELMNRYDKSIKNGILYASMLMVISVLSLAYITFRNDIYVIPMLETFPALYDSDQTDSDQTDSDQTNSSNDSDSIGN